MQTLESFQPLLELRPGRDAARRMRLCYELLDAIATHRVADRPDRYEPRVEKRRRNHYGWLTRPRAEIKRKMAKGVTKNQVPFDDVTAARSASAQPLGPPAETTTLESRTGGAGG